MAETEGLVYVAVEYVDGPTLAHIVADGGPLEWRYAVEIIQQIGSALACAHQPGIIHRDVKPTNTIIPKDGRAVLRDFWLAIAPGPPTLTETARVMGTSAYMSPEQVLGKPVDARSDIFSLGLVFYESLTGRRPFAAESPSESLRNVIEKTPIPPRDITPSVPRVIDEIVLKCLSKEPDQRFQAIDDFLSVLAKVGRPDSLETQPTPSRSDSDSPSFGTLAVVSEVGSPEMDSASNTSPRSIADNSSVAPVRRRLKRDWFAGALIVLFLGGIAVAVRSLGTAVFAVVCGILTLWFLSDRNTLKIRDWFLGPRLRRRHSRLLVAWAESQ